MYQDEGLAKTKEKRDGWQGRLAVAAPAKICFLAEREEGYPLHQRPQTLPPPLNRQEEEEVFPTCSCEEPVKQSARQLLIEHNLRLVVYIAKKFESTGI